MSEEIEKELIPDPIEVSVSVDANIEVVADAIKQLSENVPSVTGVEGLLNTQNENLAKLAGLLEQSSQPDLTLYFVSIASILVAVLGLVLAWRQHVISLREEKVAVYNEVLDSLWFFSKYSGSDPRSTDEAQKKILRVKRLAVKVFGQGAGELLTKVLVAVDELPAKFMAFNKNYNAETIEIFEKLSLDHEEVMDSMAVEYAESRLWLKKGVFDEFEKAFKI